MDNKIEQEGLKVGRMVRRPWRWASRQVTAVGARWRAEGMGRRDGFQGSSSLERRCLAELDFVLYRQQYVKISFSLRNLCPGHQKSIFRVKALTAHKMIAHSWNLDLAGVMVSFMCPLGWATVLGSLIKHQSRCGCEVTWQAR